MEGQIRSTYKYKNQPNSEPSKRTANITTVKPGKTGNKELASCFPALVLNMLNCDAYPALPAPTFEPVLQQI